MKKPFRGVWSEDYAKTWEFAMVSGNGQQGVMVFGNPNMETIIGNHNALYLPQDNDYKVPDMAPYLSELRTIIKEQGYDIAKKFYYEKAIEIGYQGLQMSDPSHPGVHLLIGMDDLEVSNYKRYTNFENGEIGIKFDDQHQVKHLRKTFVSRADDLIVHQIRNSVSDVNCTFRFAEYNQPLLLRTEQTVKEEGIKLRHKYAHSLGGYDVDIQIIVPDGKLTVINQEIQIENAKEVLVLMRMQVHKTLEDFEYGGFDLSDLPLSYERLLQRHQSIHFEMFDRVRLTITTDEQRKRLTEDLIGEAQRAKELPLALIEKMYDTGRYMFICSAGDLIPNLQGIWTGTFNPPWSGDYTFDTNVQLAIASALYSRLNEGIQGLFKLIKGFLPEFRENAMKYYGCRGIMSSVHSSNSGKHVHWNEEWPLQLWTCGAGWLGHWFYDYYLHTGDKEFLRYETIPYLKECVLFYEDFLVEENGVYLFTPSYSAENGCGDNATQDIAVAKEVLKNLIEAHIELGIYDPEIEKWQAMLSKLPSYLINEEGAIKEWAIPEKNENYNHRHFSHLYPIFGSREFNAESEPKLWQASIVALEKRLAAWMRNKDGDTSSTHGRMHAALCATRLNMSDVAYEALEMMVLSNSIYPTLMTSHYNEHNIFNVDGNGAIPQIINEMLLYGEVGKLTILGAIPSVLTSGTLSGISLPKEIIVDYLNWDLLERKITLKITSNLDQEITIAAPLFPRIKIKTFANCKALQSEMKIILWLQKNQTASITLEC